MGLAMAVTLARTKMVSLLKSWKDILRNSNQGFEMNDTTKSNFNLNLIQTHSRHYVHVTCGFWDFLEAKLNLKEYPGMICGFHLTCIGWSWKVTKISQSGSFETCNCHQFFLMYVGPSMQCLPFVPKGFISSFFFVSWRNLLIKLWLGWRS